MENTRDCGIPLHNPYKIDNQDLAALPEYAGHMVRMTGEMTGDTIKVSNIGMI